MLPESYTLQAGQLLAGFDRHSGALLSLRYADDPLQTEFLGNPQNLGFGNILKRNEWVGDWLFRLWAGDHWEIERTAASVQNRQVKATEQSLTTIDDGSSQAPEGLRRLRLHQRFFVADETLHWEAEVSNNTDAELEIGEISLPFLINHDYTSLFTDVERYGKENWRGEKQRLWHETMVQQHLSIDGAGSYLMLQRPKGDFPALLFLPDQDTPLEAAYQIDPSIGSQWSLTFEGPYYLSICSRAARQEFAWHERGEQQRYWLNGESSRLLAPGESLIFRFSFQRLDSYEQLGDHLYRAGKPDVAAWPGFTIPCEQELTLRLRLREEPTLLPLAQGVEFRLIKRSGDSYYYSITMHTTGHKKIAVQHGTATTNLFFFALPELTSALAEHARFIVREQYYDNDTDPFGRHHTFMPYDGNLQALFLESGESWQVGASDEYGLPIAMFLAAKNAISPSHTEIAILEEYVAEGILGKLQDPQSLLAIRGLYWEELSPSDRFRGGKWDRIKAASQDRSFNYPLLCDIYFGLFQIAVRHGLTERRSADDYLELAYRTACLWFTTGALKANSAPAGATIVDLLQALRERRSEWYADLEPRVRQAAEINRESLYPYGSELYIDQTPHNQLHALMAHYGFEEAEEEAVQVTEALRAGQQPAWFLNGNEKRGNVCSWYATALNSRVLYADFDESSLQRRLKLGYAGLYGALATLRASGRVTGWFTWWPDRTGFDSRSLDSDMALYGYLQTAASYLVVDPEIGLCGYGCAVTEAAESRIELVPWDGIGQRMKVYLPELTLSAELCCGQIGSLEIDLKQHRLTFRLQGASEPALSLNLESAVEWSVSYDSTIAIA